MSAFRSPAALLTSSVARRAAAIIKSSAGTAAPSPGRVLYPASGRPAFPWPSLAAPASLSPSHDPPKVPSLKRRANIPIQSVCTGSRPSPLLQAGAVIDPGERERPVPNINKEILRECASPRSLRDRAGVHILFMPRGFMSS